MRSVSSLVITVPQAGYAKIVVREIVAKGSRIELLHKADLECMARRWGPNADMKQ